MTIPARLSVVLPNYNHAKLIGRALTALLAQETAPDEIIIVDDGSTDDSMRVIAQFAAKTPSISVLANPSNIGVIAALQRGLQAARGEYIYFAAADDFVLPGFFECALRRLSAVPEAGLFCGEAVLIDGHKGRPFAIRPAVRPTMRSARLGGAQVAELLRSSDNWILTGSAVFRRDCVLWAGGFDERLGSFADGMLARKVALKYGFFFEPKVVAAWVVFADSVSRKTALEPGRTMQALDVVPTLIGADSAFPQWYANAFRDRWRFATCRLALQAQPIDRELVLAMGARSTEERAQLARILSLPGRKIVNLAVLAGLWYRLRPAKLTALLRTMLAMRFVRFALAFRFGRFRSLTPAAASSADG